MNRVLPRLLIALMVCAGCLAAKGRASASEPPKLVVVVSVDQLAAGYLARFHDHFREDGIFRRFEQQGASYLDCHHGHAFTITGPGHSVMLTGTFPRRTGIVGNAWFDRATGSTMYCVADAEVTLIGGTGAASSPRNLLVETVGDVLKEATDGKAKVYGISLKDRAGILMAGRKADGAFWLERSRWVTSSYYEQGLPASLAALNNAGAARRFGGKTWELMNDASQYQLNRPDDYPHEGTGAGLGRAFPHTLAEADTPEYDKQLPITPFGNELTLQAARALIEGEELGADDVPDLLCIGLSSNDYVGHNYGPLSLEVEDITYRTDAALGELAEYLDERVGRGAWVLALTADHGVAPIPEYARERGLEAGRDPLGTMGQLAANLEAALAERFGPAAGEDMAGGKYVLAAEEHQIFLDTNQPALGGENLAAAENVVADYLRAQPAVAAAMTREELAAEKGQDRPLEESLRRAFHPGRSGEVLYALKPLYIQGGSPATHGSPWPYDTHVPLLLYGPAIHPGAFERKVTPAALAPTLAQVLGVRPPAECEEEPLREALEPAP